MKPGAQKPLTTGGTYLGDRHKTAKSAESVIEHLFCNHGVEVTDKQLCPNFHSLLLVGGGFVNSDRLSIQADLIHDPGGIFGVFLADKFYKSIALMGLSNTIFREMHINDSARLQHELPYQTVCDTFVQVTDIDCSFFILLPAIINLSTADSYLLRKSHQSNIPMPGAGHGEQCGQG
jgi:hypothetical protein